MCDTKKSLDCVMQKGVTHGDICHFYPSWAKSLFSALFFSFLILILYFIKKSIRKEEERPQKETKQQRKVMGDMCDTCDT